MAAALDVIEVAPVDLGIPAQSITAVTRITSYSRVAPFVEDYAPTLPYFVALVGTRTGHMHAISVQPPPPALSLRPKHQRNYRVSAARETLQGKAKVLSSTPVNRGNVNSPCSPSSFRRGGSFRNSTPKMTPMRPSVAGLDNSKPMMTAGEPATKVVFSPQSCRVFALAGGSIYCHFLDVASGFEFNFMGAVTAPNKDPTAVSESLTGCIDFAVTSRPDCSVVLGILTETHIVICTFDGDTPLHLNAIKHHATCEDRCAWCSGTLVVSHEKEKEYRFYSATSERSFERFAAKTSALVMTPMHDSWDYDDKTRTRKSAHQIALVTRAQGDDFFRYDINIVRCEHDSVHVEKKFRALSTTQPTAIVVWGPWLLVSTAVGIEVYSWRSEQLLQSIMDEAVVSQLTLAMRANQQTNAASEATVADFYTTRGYELAIARLGEGSEDTTPYACTISLQSPMNVVAEMMRNLDVQQTMDGNQDLLENLVWFGHSVGALKLFPDDVEVPNMSFDPGSPMRLNGGFGGEGTVDNYLDLMVSFRNPGAPPKSEKAELCAVCNDTFRFYRRSVLCSTCGEHVCELRKCSIQHDTHTRICGNCAPNFAPDLYVLVANRLYAQALRYLMANSAGDEDDDDGAGPPPWMPSSPSKAVAKYGSAYTLRQTGSVILQKCLTDGKVVACVLLLPSVVGRREELWREWIQRFGIANATSLLARYIPWRTLRRGTSPAWLFSLLLTSLTVTDATKLLESLQVWPRELYDVNTVSLAIEQTLERLLQHATNVVTKSRPNFFPEEAFAKRQAIGLLFRTAKVEHLILALCFLHEGGDSYAEAVKIYLQKWVAYAPPKPLRVNQAFQTGVPFVTTAAAENGPQHPDPFQRIVDLDLISLLRSTPASPSVLPLVMEVKGNETGKWLTQLLDIRTRPDLIQDLVTQLQKLEVEYADRHRAILARWKWMPEAANHVDVGQVILEFLDGLSSGSKQDVKVTAAFHRLQAELYIKYKPEKLLDFLRNDLVSNIDWPSVDRYVRERKMYRELAYVVSRSGNYSEALRLIVRSMRSVKYAIEFVTDVNGGEELWNELMLHVRQNATLIEDFLVYGQGRVELSKFFRSIPTQNRLRLGPKQLGGVMSNANITAALNRSSLASFKEDNLIAMHNMGTRRRGAVRFNASQGKCELCEGEINFAARATGLATCGHLFHVTCVEEHLKAKPRPKRGAARRRRGTEWDRVWANYSDWAEDGVSDLAQLLPERLFARTLSFLPADENRRVAATSKSWSAAAALGRAYGREQTDVTCVLSEKPVSVATLPSRVEIGDSVWTKAIRCPRCAVPL
jgi:hypothetical protein